MPCWSSCWGYRPELRSGHADWLQAASRQIGHKRISLFITHQFFAKLGKLIRVTNKETFNCIFGLWSA